MRKLTKVNKKADRASKPTTTTLDSVVSKLHDDVDGIRMYKITANAGEVSTFDSASYRNSDRKLPQEQKFWPKVVCLLRGQYKTEYADPKTGEIIRVRETNPGDSFCSEENPSSIITQTVTKDGSEWYCVQVRDLRDIKQNLKYYSKGTVGVIPAYKSKGLVAIVLEGSVTLDDGTGVDGPAAIMDTVDDTSTNLQFTCNTDVAVLFIEGRRHGN